MRIRLALTFPQCNDDPADVIPMHKVHGIDPVDLVCHVPCDEGDAFLALDNLAVDGVSRAVFHTELLQLRFLLESLACKTHDANENLSRARKSVNGSNNTLNNKTLTIAKTSTFENVTSAEPRNQRRDRTCEVRRLIECKHSEGDQACQASPQLDPDMQYHIVK